MKSTNKKKRYLIAAASIFFVAAVAVFFIIKRQPYSYKETGVPAHVELSPRLQKLFAKTKTVCFGRYVLDVPEEAQLIFGSFDIGAVWKLYPDQAKNITSLSEQYRASVLEKDRTAEFTYSGPGEVPNSIQIHSFKSNIAKQLNLEGFYTVVAVGENAYSIKTGYAPSEGEPRVQVLSKITDLLKNLRPRNNAEIPKESGVCIDEGFVGDSDGKYQEIFAAGIHMPSISDVSFSVSSNKLASVTDGNGTSLLESIAEQKELMGEKYPNLTVLR